MDRKTKLAIATGKNINSYKAETVAMHKSVEEILKKAKQK